jgi:formylglycine-generating enzyme required for sulfatase activity
VTVRRLVAIALVVGALALLPQMLRAPGDAARVWDDPLTRSRFRLLDPGVFRMGTPPAEERREPQESLHEVRLTRGFYVSETEVTQAAWRRVMGSNPSHFEACGPRCPVERVNWHDVQRFIGRLNAQGTPGYRLPTEAEWEYACRGGSPLPFGHRATLSSRDANINGNYPYQAPRGVHRQSTTPVGRFPPNAFGLYDMSGNVWEWTADDHCPYPAGPATDPIGACGSQYKVIRGGSWAFDAGSARCGVRYTHRPQDLGYSLGFRLAHDVF